MKNKDEKEEKITIEGELRVKELLEERGISMQDFAASIGIVRETLTRTLKGNPRYDTLKAIADGLGMTVPELFRSNRGQNIKPEKQVVHGYIEIGDEIHAIRNLEQYVGLMNKVDGIVHIASFTHQEEHKNAIMGFFSTSILPGKSDAIMARYGLNKAFTMTYDATSERLSLTLCVGDGEIRFRIFSISDYKTEPTLSRLEMIKLLEDILTEIETVDDEE